MIASQLRPRAPSLQPFALVGNPKADTHTILVMCLTSQYHEKVRLQGVHPVRTKDSTFLAVHQVLALKSLRADVIVSIFIVRQTEVRQTGCPQLHDSALRDEDAVLERRRTRCKAKVKPFLADRSRRQCATAKQPASPSLLHPDFGPAEPDTLPRWAKRGLVGKVMRRFFHLHATAFLVFFMVKGGTFLQNDR